MSGLEVLACSLDTGINYVYYHASIAPFAKTLSTGAAIFRAEMLQLSGCVIVVGPD